MAAEDDRLSPWRHLIQGVVLAGGQSRRMARDKGLLPLNGRPLVSHAADALAPQVDAVCLNPPLSGMAAYEGLGWPLCPDPVPGQPGPLAGYLAGMHSTHPWVVTVPCDSPAPPPDLVARLFRACEEAGATLAVARGPERLHPVFALLHCHWYDTLTAALAAGERRAGTWLQTMGALEVEFPDEVAFANINTPEDLAHWNEFEVGSPPGPGLESPG